MRLESTSVRLTPSLVLRRTASARRRSHQNGMRSAPPLLTTARSSRIAATNALLASAGLVGAAEAAPPNRDRMKARSTFQPLDHEA